MGILAWSFGFVLLLSILAWSSFGRLAEETVVAKTTVAQVKLQATQLTKRISTKSILAYDRYRECMGLSPICDADEEEEEEEEERPLKKRRLARKRGRLTSKLHISALFSSGDNGQKQTQEKIFRNLLTVLYYAQPILTPQPDNGVAVHQLFDEVRAKAVEWGTKLPIRKAAAIANIELSGPRKEAKQFALFLILRGGQGEIFPGALCTVPPLLSYVDASRKGVCLSPFIAPTPLLKALFENDDVVAQVVAFRAYALRRIRSEENKFTELSSDSNKEDILDILSEEFQMQFEPLLPPSIDPQYIDFQISRTAVKSY